MGSRSLVTILLLLFITAGVSSVSAQAPGGPPGQQTGIAFDQIWDATGDLAVGAGVNAATRLPRGTVGQKLSGTASDTAWKDEPWGDLVVEYEAECDGTSDDEPELEAAFTALTTSGGTIFVPDGKICAIAAPVAMKSNVMIRCGKGAGFKIVGGSWTNTNGMFEAFDPSSGAAGQGNLGIDGCDFNLNDEPASAMRTVASTPGTPISTLTERFTFTNNYITGAEDDAAANAQLLHITCASFGTPSWCANVSNNAINCAGHASNDGGDTGIYVHAAASSGGGAVTNNSVRDCDEIGISQIMNNADLIGNAVLVGTGAGAVGINVSGSDAQVGNNAVNVPSGSATGIAFKSGAPRQTYANNSAIAGGATSIAYQVTSAGSDVSFVGNVHSINGADAIGYDIDAPVVIAGATGNRATTNGDIHVLLRDDATQTQITGSKFVGGDWCIRPPRDAAPPGNVRVNATICYNQDFGAIMLATGWHVVGNTMNWTGDATGSSAVLWLGDDATTDGSNQYYCTVHSVITGNNFHSGTNTVDAMIWAPRAASGTPPDCNNIVISGNLFISGINSGKAMIDLAEGCTSNCPDFDDIEISGNNGSLLSSGMTLVGLPTASSGTLTGINIGPNTCDDQPCVRGYSPSMGHLRDEPREACIAVDNVNSTTTIRPYWVAPSTGAKIVAASCVYGDLDGVGSCSASAPILEWEDQSGNVVTSSITCRAISDSPPGVWTTTTGTLTTGELLTIDVTTAGDTDCDVLACVQYTF